MEKKENQLVKKMDEFTLVTEEDIKNHFCPTAEKNEIALFLNIAKLNQLNPFKREIYIVKYGDNPATILTGYEVYLKRAERSGFYNGFKVWTEGKVPDLVAKIEVYRKDWSHPLTHEVEYCEYVQYKTNKKTGDKFVTKFWKDKPKTMLKKVVISQAFRLAFPDELGGMPYTSDEINTIDAEVVPVSKKADVKMPEAIEDKAYDFKEGPPVDTNDLPPYDEPEASEPAADNEESVRMITKPQQKRMFAIAYKSGWKNSDIKEFLKSDYGIEHTDQIPLNIYESIIEYFTNVNMGGK